MLTVTELASAVGVTPQAARNWLSRRPELGIRVGNRRLVPRWAVRAYKQSQDFVRAKAITEVPPKIRAAIKRNTRKSGDCRMWTGPLGHDGLPRLVTTQSYPVNRYAYVARHGPLTEGVKVKSGCGDSRCLEPLIAQ